MTTSPLARVGASWVSTQVSKADRLIALSITQGAVMPWQRSPAMKVCVPQWPNGASAISLVPRRLRPRSRTILVFTEVSSTKTRRCGSSRILGWRRVDPDSPLSTDRCACAFRRHQGLFYM